MTIPFIQTLFRSRKGAMLASATKEGDRWSKYHQKEMHNLERRLEERHKEEMNLKDVENIRLEQRIETLEHHLKSMERLHDKSILRSIENEKVASQMDAAIFRMLNKHGELFQFIQQIKSLAEGNHKLALKEDDEFKSYRITQ